MRALPMALARHFISSSRQFHDKRTTDKERNALAEQTLHAFREHDPNVSVWDLLPIYDAKVHEEYIGGTK